MQSKAHKVPHSLSDIKQRMTRADTDHFHSEDP